MHTIHVRKDMSRIAVLLFVCSVLSSPLVSHAATASITITETSVNAGVPYNVSWTSSGATSCTVSGPGVSSTALNGGPISVTQTTTGVKTYNISCSSTTAGCVWTDNGTGNTEDFPCLTDHQCTAGAVCSPQGAFCRNETDAPGNFCRLDNYTCSGSCTTSTVTGTDSVTVNPAPPPTATLNASLTTVPYASPQTTLTWSSTNASTCTGTGFSTGGAANNSTGVVVSPTQNTTYSISCSGLTAPPGTASRTITVTGVPAPVVAFSASPATVALGGSSTLTWSATNAGTGCTGTGFLTNGATSGSASVQPAVNTTYSISCTGQGGTGVGAAGVGVTGGGGAATVIVFDGNDGQMHAIIKPDAPAIYANPIGWAIYAGWANERNRVCTLVDPTSYPTTFQTRSFDSPGDNSVIKYNGSTWYLENAGGSNNIKYANWPSSLICMSPSTPDTALSGNGVAGTASITVASGTAVNLTWLSQYGNVRKATCSAQNFSTDTWIPESCVETVTCDTCGTGGQVCAAAPRKPIATTPLSKALAFLGIEAEVAHALGQNGRCTTDITCTPAHSGPSPFGGTTTVFPTVTTTYTYTCTNAIGSTAKSITVNIPTGPACSDGLDNDSDGTCDIGGCTVNSVVLPADPGCMSGTDVNEDPNPPPNPVGLTATCASDGQSVSFDWSDAAGATAGYYLRVDKPVGTTCPAPWITAPWNPNRCYPQPDNVPTSAYNNYPVTPGVAYNGWNVHSITPANGEYSSGAWGVAFTCTPVVPPVSGSCSVSPLSANTGTPVSWSASASGGNGTYTYVWTIPTGTPSSGTSNPQTTTYSSGGSKTASVIITSNGVSSSPISCNADSNPGDGTVAVTAIPVATLSASPDPVPSGTASTLTWDCDNSTSASISSIGAVSPTANGSVSTGNLSNPPQASYSYTLTCTGATGSDTDSYTVDVINPTVNLTATPDHVESVPPNNSSLIAWSGALVDACTVTRDGAAFAAGGAAGSQSATNITKQTLFNVVCSAGAIPNVANDSALVNVEGNYETF